MSWITKVNNAMTIRTGDGKTYTPNWMNATKAKAFNASEFEFVEVAGALVKRTTSKGRRFALQIFFQGENNLDTADEFETSSEDSRAWVISHPLYGRLLVQPLSMTFDNTKMNVTEVNCEVVETIDDKRPKTTSNPLDEIKIKKGLLDDQIVDNFSGLKLNANDVTQMSGYNSSLFNAGSKTGLITSDFETYFNAFNKANAAISNAISNVSGAILAIQAVINAPALFVNNITNRLSTLKDQFDRLSTSVVNLVSPNSKSVYEANLGMLIGAMASATVEGIEINNGVAINALGNPINRIDILQAISSINTYYNKYLENLDSLQTDDYGDLDSYIPNAENQILLNDLMLFTTANLFDIINVSRQERTVFIPEDSNLIELAHRYFGLTQDDSSIDDFIRLNDITLNEYFLVRKGRAITYYV